MGVDRGYAVTEVPEPPTLMSASLRQRLERRRDNLEAQLEKVKAAIVLLDQNPGFEALHDALAKAGF